MLITTLITIFTLIILLFSVIIHELAHGSVAYSLGDPTAKYAGRLTLNPLKHLDPLGSVIVPLMLLLATGGQGPIFGWAKPVPVNPYNFKDQKWGALKVAIAGPATNFGVAIFFGLVGRFLPLLQSVKVDIISSFLTGNQNNLSASLSAYTPLSTLFLFFSIISIYNFLWGIFNLLPMPPLDGSWILFKFLPQRAEKARIFLEQYGLFILIFLIFFGGLNVLSYSATYLFTFIAGV